MSKQEIVSELANNKLIEKFVEIKGRGWLISGTEQDLIQDMYLYILEMKEEKVVSLYTAGELPFYLCRAVQNQCRGIHTGYHKTYRSWSKNKIELFDIVDEGEEI